MTQVTLQEMVFTRLTLMARGEIEPFEVYCDMTTNGGGWTLFANRQEGLSIEEIDIVDPGQYGVVTAQRWNALKDNMSDGMMFIDENNKMSYINKDKLNQSGICRTINDNDSLVSGARTIWHQEGDLIYYFSPQTLSVIIIKQK